MSGVASSPVVSAGEAASPAKVSALESYETAESTCSSLETTSSTGAFQAVSSSYPDCGPSGVTSCPKGLRDSAGGANSDVAGAAGSASATTSGVTLVADVRPGDTSGCTTSRTTAAATAARPPLLNAVTRLKTGDRELHGSTLFACGGMGISRAISSTSRRMSGCPAAYRRACMMHLLALCTSCRVAYAMACWISRRALTSAGPLGPNTLRSTCTGVIRGPHGTPHQPNSSDRRFAWAMNLAAHPGHSTAGLLPCRVKYRKLHTQWISTARTSGVIVPQAWQATKGTGSGSGGGACVAPPVRACWPEGTPARHASSYARREAGSLRTPYASTRSRNRPVAPGPLFLSGWSCLALVL